MTEVHIPVIAQEVCEHTESLGELRHALSLMLQRLEAVERRVEAVEGSGQVNVSTTPVVEFEGAFSDPRPDVIDKLLALAKHLSDAGYSL